MRLRWNRDLQDWDRSETGRRAGVERPLPGRIFWVNEIFGKDWDHMKAKRLPPQRSKRSMVKGDRRRMRNRSSWHEFFRILLKSLFDMVFASAWCPVGEQHCFVALSPVCLGDAARS